MASDYFIKINPYLFICQKETPNTLDSLYTQYLLTNAAQKKYRTIFESTFYKKQSVIFKKFEKMYVEDQEIRKALHYCNDDFTCNKLTAARRIIDLNNFEFLYEYVNKNGWPSIENGSLFARVIAIHDHSRFDQYIPIIKKAVLDGVVPLSTYTMMMTYKKMENTSWQHAIDMNKSIEIYINTTIDNKMPDSITLKKIECSVREHCDIKYIFFVFESNNKKDSEIWFESMTKILVDEGKETVIEKLYNTIEDNMCGGSKNTFIRHRMVTGVKKKMILYLVY